MEDAMKRVRALTVACLLLLLATVVSADETRLLRNPDISDSQIVFVYADDIWIADRDGGDTRRLTTSDGSENEPHFSPDGMWVAFSGQYGNTDVYVVPAEGGDPV
jgi:tricorn protease